MLAVSLLAGTGSKLSVGLGGLKVYSGDPEAASCVHTFLDFHTFPGSQQVVTDTACGLTGGNDRAYLRG